MVFADVFASFNWALLAVVVAVILGFLGMGKFYKTEQTKKMANLVAVIGVGIFLAGAFVPQASVLLNPIQFPGQGEPGAVATTPTQTVIPGCNVEDTTVTLSAINKYNATSTGGTHRYRVNGDPALTVSDAGSFTASPGDSLEILWYNADSDRLYFSDVTSEVIPCRGTKTYSNEFIYLCVRECVW